MRLHWFATAVLLFFGLAAPAETITFSNSAGVQLSAPPYFLASYTEGSFTAQVLAGKIAYDTFQDAATPNPNFAAVGLGLTDYTHTILGVGLTQGGLFYFSGLDYSIYTGGLERLPLTVVGYRNGQQVGTESFSLLDQFNPAYQHQPFVPETATVLNGVPLDQLQIYLDGGTFPFRTFYNQAVDNINVTPAAAVTPEPSGMVLLGTGLLMAIGTMRRHPGR